MSPASRHDDETARASVLAAADAAFYARGVGATSIAELRDASGVSLRRVYALYPSKQDLVAAWLEARHTSWLAWFRTGIEGRVGAGATPVDAIFDTIAEWASAPGYRGCAFLNTAAEQGEIDERHRRIIAEHKRSLIRYLAELMRGAGAREPESLAAALGVLVDGAIVEAAVLSSLDPVQAAKAAAARLVAA